MDLRNYAIEQARRYNIPTDMFLRLIGAESGWNGGAVSNKGAIGYGQLMPDTAKELGVDPTDPLQNIEGSARYLAQMYGRFGDWPLALAGYNAGPRAVEMNGGIPPFKETQNYVNKIMAGNNIPPYSGSGAPPARPMTMREPAGFTPDPFEPFKGLSPIERLFVATGYEQDAKKAPIANIWSAIQGKRMSPDELLAMDEMKKKQGGGFFSGLLSMLGGA